MNQIKKIIATITITSFVLIGMPVAGITVAELEASIALLTQQLTTLQSQLVTLQGGTATSTVPTVCVGVTFAANLKLGSTGVDVKCLQALLNTDIATKLAETGAGSPGNETTYFGSITKTAVIKFQEKYASEVLASYGLTTGTGFVGATTRAKLNSILAAGVVTPTTPTTTPTTTIPTTGTGLNVAVAADNPIAGAILSGQTKAVLLKLTFTNNDATDVKVTQIKINRLGYAADGAVAPIFLYEGNTRLTETGEIFLIGVATFKETTVGLFTVGAGQSKTITVAGNVQVAGIGQVIGVGITAAANITSNATAVSGTFPISGSVQTILVGAGLLANVGVATTVIANAVPRGGDTNVELWKGTLTPAINDVVLTYVQFREVGSIYASDIQNLKLYVDGVQAGTSTSLSATKRATFDLSASPVSLIRGARLVVLKGDIISGSGRAATFELRGEDIILTDAQYGSSILINPNPAGNWTYAHTLVNIGAGRLVMDVASDSPTGVATTTEALLAKFTLKAFGERVTVLNMNVTTTLNATTTNVNVYVNGGLVGTTPVLSIGIGRTIAITGTSIEPGASVTVEIKGNTLTIPATSTQLTVVFITGNTPTLTNNVFAIAKTTSFDITPTTMTGAFAGAPAAGLVLAGTSPVVAQYKFTSAGTKVNLTRVDITTVSTTATSSAWNVINYLRLKIGETTYAKDDTFSTATTSVFLLNPSIEIGAGQSKTADVIATLLGVSGGTDGLNIATVLVGFRYLIENQEIINNTVTATSSYPISVYKSNPTVKPETTGVNSTNPAGTPTLITLYKATITANGGDVRLSTTTLYIVKPGWVASTTLASTTVQIWKGGEDLVASGKVGYQITGAGTPDWNLVTSTTSTLIITPTALGISSGAFDIASAGSITLEVKVSATFPTVGVGAQKGYVIVNILGDAAFVDPFGIPNAQLAGNFVWNDRVNITAGQTNVNGYLVTGLPAAGTATYTNTTQ